MHYDMRQGEAELRKSNLTPMFHHLPSVHTQVIFSKLVEILFSQNLFCQKMYFYTKSLYYIISNLRVKSYPIWLLQWNFDLVELDVVEFLFQWTKSFRLNLIYYEKLLDKVDFFKKADSLRQTNESTLSRFLQVSRTSPLISLSSPFLKR